MLRVLTIASVVLLSNASALTTRTVLAGQAREKRTATCELPDCEKSAAKGWVWTGTSRCDVTANGTAWSECEYILPR